MENWPDNLFYIIPEALAGEGNCVGWGKAIFARYLPERPAGQAIPSGVLGGRR